jgi:hypothetical protein
LFGARRSIANPGIGRNDQEETRYEPRVFDGRIIQSDHKGVLDCQRIESISGPMRAFIEELWPEPVHKLRPKKAHG